MLKIYYIIYRRMCYSKRNWIQHSLRHFFFSRSKFSRDLAILFGKKIDSATYIIYWQTRNHTYTYSEITGRLRFRIHSHSILALVRASQTPSHSINNTDRAIPGLLIACKWTHRESSCFFFFGSIGCSVLSSREKTGVATRPRVNHFTIWSISRIHSVRELGNFMDECFADVRDKNIRSGPADINAETLRMPRDLEAKIYET